MRPGTKKSPVSSPKKGKKLLVRASVPDKIVFTILSKEEVEKNRCSVYPYSL